MQPITLKLYICKNYFDNAMGSYYSSVSSNFENAFYPTSTHRFNFKYSYTDYKD